MARKTVIVLNSHKKPIKGTHMSVRIRTEPVIHTFDDQKLGKGPADEIRDYVEREIRSIVENVAGSTSDKRKRAGIVGKRLFNATGKLAKGLTVALDRDLYKTQTPRDRLTGETRKLLPQLLELIDIKPREIVKDRGVRAAIADTLKLIFKKGRMR